MTAQTFDRSANARVSLWFGFVAGPTAWTIHLLLSYFIASSTCGLGEGPVKAVLFAVSAAFAAICIFGSLTSWRLWRDESAETRYSQTRHSRLQFMELCGVVLGGYFAVAIVMESIPIIALNACQP
jgi:hypothetical protein